MMFIFSVFVLIKFHLRKKCLDNKITFLFVDLKAFEEIQNLYPVYM